MRKILGIIVIVAALAYVLFSCFAGNQAQKKGALPTERQAAYLVETPTDVYYARSCRKSGDALIIKDYYERQGYEWKLVRDEKLLKDARYARR